MAKLNALPDQQVISALNGIVDFYFWKGIPVARRWPTWIPRTATGAEASNQQKFAAVAVMTGAVSDSVRASFADVNYGDVVTWVDAFRATALGKPWVRYG